MWTADVLTLAGPFLAFSGAAFFTGSVIHPHNLAVPRTAHAVRRWSWLTGLRIAFYALVALAASLAGSTPEVVVAAVRWGWILAPLGLVAAALVR